MTTARSRHELNSWKLIWLVFSFSVAEFGWTAVFGQRQSEFGEIPQARRGLDEYRFMSLTCRSLMRILQDGLTFGPTPRLSRQLHPAVALGINYRLENSSAKGRVFPR